MPIIDAEPVFQPLCAVHPTVFAATTCGRCGAFGCGTCLQPGRLEGRDVVLCPRCRESGPELATLGERLGAHLLDHLAVLGPPGLLVWPMLELAPEWFFLPPLLLLFALIVAQYVLLALRAQTLGKLALKIKIVRTDGSRPSFLHVVVLRSWVPQAAAALVGFFGVIDYCFIFEERRRCLHDRIADTLVVKA